MTQEEHSAMHHVQQTLINQLVLMVDHLDDALLNGQGHWDVEDLVISFLYTEEACL